MVFEEGAGEKKLSVFEKYLTGWVALCIIAGTEIIRGQEVPLCH